MAIRKMQLHFNKATKVAPDVIHMHFYPKYESYLEVRQASNLNQKYTRDGIPEIFFEI